MSEAVDNFLAPPGPAWPASIIPGGPEAPPPSVVQAAELVARATAEMAAADEAERTARRVATDARNALNNAQKLFDAAVMRLKSEAPNGSDWNCLREPASG